MASKRSVGKEIKRADDAVFEVVKKGIESAKEIISSNSCSLPLFAGMKRLRNIDNYDGKYKGVLGNSEGIVTTASRICDDGEKGLVPSMGKARDAINSFFSKALDASSEMLENGDCSDENVKTVVDAIHTMDAMVPEGLKTEDNPNYTTFKFATNACIVKKEKL